MRRNKNNTFDWIFENAGENIGTWLVVDLVSHWDRCDWWWFESHSIVSIFKIFKFLPSIRLFWLVNGGFCWLSKFGFYRINRSSKIINKSLRIFLLARIVVFFFFKTHFNQVLNWLEFVVFYSIGFFDLLNYI